MTGTPDAATQANNLDQIVTFEEREMLPYTYCANIKFLAQFGCRHLPAMAQQMQNALPSGALLFALDSGNLIFGASTTHRFVHLCMSGKVLVLAGRQASLLRCCYCFSAIRIIYFVWRKQDKVRLLHRKNASI
jgi:hypothetical protein